MPVIFPLLRIVFSVALLISAACVGPASAEDVENADDVEETEDGEDIVYEMEAITVTGSRIKSDEHLTPAPVVVLSRDEIKVRGLASIGDVLQTLTVQSNAINTQANNGGDGSTRISLRGLGAHRTLVLLNGRRFVPGGTGANSSVDLNAIPASAVETRRSAQGRRVGRVWFGRGRGALSISSRGLKPRDWNSNSTTVFRARATARRWISVLLPA